MDQKPIYVFFFLLSVTLASATAPTPSSSATGSDLIATTCNHAVYKDLCVETLKADPVSREADVLGLTSIAIKTAMHNGTLVHSHIRQLSKEMSTDPFAQQCLSDCSENYIDAIDQLEDSIAALDSKAYNDVSTWIQAAMSDAESCEDGFKDQIGHKPLITAKNTVFSQLCSNALALTNYAASL